MCLKLYQTSERQIKGLTQFYLRSRIVSVCEQLTNTDINNMQTNVLITL